MPRKKAPPLRNQQRFVLFSVFVSVVWVLDEFCTKIPTAPCNTMLSSLQPNQIRALYTQEKNNFLERNTNTGLPPVPAAPQPSTHLNPPPIMLPSDHFSLNIFPHFTRSTTCAEGPDQPFPTSQEAAVQYLGAVLCTKNSWLPPKKFPIPVLICANPDTFLIFQQLNLQTSCHIRSLSIPSLNFWWTVHPQHWQHCKMEQPTKHVSHMILSISPSFEVLRQFVTPNFLITLIRMGD